MIVRAFTVQSSSRPGVTYKVMVFQDKIVCTCPHYQLRHAECKHIVAIKRKYGRKQTTQSRPVQPGRAAAEVRSDDKGQENRGNPVPSGELRGSDSEHGNDPGDVRGGEHAGSQGRGSSSENAEAGVGTPDAGVNVPGPAQGSDQTPPGEDPEVREPNTPKKCANHINGEPCPNTTTNYWCDDCRNKYLPDPRKPSVKSIEEIQAKYKAKAESLPPTPRDENTFTKEEIDELFSNIPPAPPGMQDTLDF